MNIIVRNGVFHVEDEPVFGWIASETLADGVVADAGQAVEGYGDTPTEAYHELLIHRWELGPDARTPALMQLIACEFGREDWWKELVEYDANTQRILAVVDVIRENSKL